MKSKTKQDSCINCEYARLMNEEKVHAVYCSKIKWNISKNSFPNNCLYHKKRGEKE